MSITMEGVSKAPIHAIIELSVICSVMPANQLATHARTTHAQFDPAGRDLARGQLKFRTGLNGEVVRLKPNIPDISQTRLHSCC